MKESHDDGSAALVVEELWMRANACLDRGEDPLLDRSWQDSESKSTAVQLELRSLLGALPLLVDLPQESTQMKSRWRPTRRAVPLGLCMLAAAALLLLVARPFLGLQGDQLIEGSSMSSPSPLEAGVQEPSFAGLILDWSVRTRIDGPRGFVEAVVDSAGHYRVAESVGPKGPGILFASVSTSLTNTRRRATIR